MFYHVRKTSLKKGKSYIESLEWVINKRATINPKNKDNRYFQYSTTVALNHENIENHHQILNPLSISIIGKVLSFLLERKTGKSLNEIIRQLLLIFCLYDTIQKQ